MTAPFFREAAISFALAIAAGSAGAGEPWLAPGDVQVRHDVELLVDSGAIELPMSGWPIPISDLAHALANAVPAGRRKRGNTAGQAGATALEMTGAASAPAFSAAQSAALARLRKLAVEGNVGYGFELDAAARPTTLRTFADTPREEGELSVFAAGFVGQRFGGRLELTGTADPDDDKAFRLDGSYVAGKFGNWIVTLGAQDRWWGAGWENSLILSNNARPVPAIALDRAVSEPFETKWLSWIGPWRLTTFMGRMEGGREDYDHPLLFGMRLSARPLEGLEISVERAAQWCGEGRSCTWGDFWNLFVGNDNAGENVDAEDEPGNQLASWAVRWASPIGHRNYAIYNQHTGESIDNSFPRPYRSFDVVGVETWGEGSDGSSWRSGIAWSNTRCGGTQDEQRLWDCAYNNNIFDPDGYRYYGRPMGHSMDGDGQAYSLRYVRVDDAAATLTGLLRFSQINEGGTVPDARNSVAPGPEDWWSVDVLYRYPLRTGWIEAGIGADSRDREWNETDAILPRASITWHHDF